MPPNKDDLESSVSHLGDGAVTAASNEILLNATRAVRELLRSNPLLDGKAQYIVCLLAAGNTLAEYTPPSSDPSPPLNAAVGLIRGALETARAANPRYSAAQDFARMPVDGATKN